MGRQINGSERLNCQRCSGWDVLAHYLVFCLRMEAVPHPSIHPSVHPYIHPAVEFCVSAIHERDRYTYIPRDRNTRNKDRH